LLALALAPVRPAELIDEAMLRPGRLGKEIEVPLPDEAGLFRTSR